MGLHVNHIGAIHLGMLTHHYDMYIDLVRVIATLSMEQEMEDLGCQLQVTQLG